MADREDIIILNQSEMGKFPLHWLSHYFTHIICYQGSGKFELGGKFYTINPNDIVIWLPSAKVSEVFFSIDFRGEFFFMSYDIATENNPNISWGIKAYLFSKENPVVPLSDNDMEKCRKNLEEIKSKNEDKNHLFYQEILKRQIQIFILEMWQIFSEKINQKTEEREQNIPIFQQFLLLVETYCMEHREVSFYADKLCITPKYLTELCNKNSGKSASEWIQNYTTQRIITLLKNPNLSLVDISYALNFSSQSFFSRYVRKVLGVSPNEFRKKMK